MQVQLHQMYKLPEDHILVHVVAGGLAGSVAAIITNPLDILKTKLQVDPAAKNLRSVFRALRKEHGYRGFAVGMGPRILSHAPRASLSFILYELAMKVSGQDLRGDD